jgi:hypothetical protein
MPIWHMATYYIKIVQDVTITVVCEGCGQVYKLNTEIIARTASVIDWDSPFRLPVYGQLARHKQWKGQIPQIISNQLQREQARLLELPLVGPVLKKTHPVAKPCPHCGYWQSWIVRKRKAARGDYLLPTSIICLGILASYLWPTSRIADLINEWGDVGIIFIVVMMILVAIGCIASVLHHLYFALRDPNHAWLAERGLSRQERPSPQKPTVEFGDIRFAE